MLSPTFEFTTTAHSRSAVIQSKVSPVGALTSDRASDSNGKDTPSSGSSSRRRCSTPAAVPAQCVFYVVCEPGAAARDTDEVQATEFLRARVDEIVRNLHPSVDVCPQHGPLLLPPPFGDSPTKRLIRCLRN